MAKALKDNFGAKRLMTTIHATGIKWLHWPHRGGDLVVQVLEASKHHLNQLERQLSVCYPRIER